MTKRIFDVVLSAAGLVCLSPLFLVIAIAVKLQDGGPVFFRQERVGLHGNIFRIFKFRSMIVQEHAVGSNITARGDNRITRVGAVLRRVKLDELPQLLNVLLGDMSLVGPRPEVGHLMAKYPAAVREIIISVRPGMTDFAALELFDEEVILAASQNPERTYLQVIMPRKAALYQRYVNEQSLLTDIMLIFRTIARIFHST